MTSSLADTPAWLVDIPSETGNEPAIRDVLADRLADLPTRLVNRSLVVGDPGPGKVILAGHTDTVPLQGHVGARIEGGRLHGLGATGAVWRDVCRELTSSRTWAPGTSSGCSTPERRAPFPATISG